MEKLSGLIKKIKEFIKNLPSKTRKLLLIVIVFLISILSFFLVYSNIMKYGLLYSDLDPSDNKYIHEQLVEMGVDVKIRGKSIYVPRSKVDELRLTFSPDLKGGSKGFELLDKSSGFGFTDEEFLIQKQRIVQGELERTIKSFSQVKDSRVHITPSKTSVFMNENDPARASVYVRLNAGESLSREQVKSIIHLVSSAWNNLPFQNVEVVDSRMNLLSLGIYDGSDDLNFAGSLDAHMNLERKFEHELENRLLSVIEPVLGVDKVKIRVNADLDFDSKKRTDIIIDENKVPISEHIIKEENTYAANGSGGPIDNNMSNVEMNSNGDSSKREESTVNYEVSKSESTIIHAPGEIKRITTSLVYDGNMTEDMKVNLESIINGVIGFNGERGDSISVVGMKFNGVKPEIFPSRRINYMSIIIIIIMAIIGIFILKMLKKGKAKKEKEEISQNIVDAKDMIQQSVEENLRKNNIEDITPENKMLEDEIKAYAVNKTSQVVDIIKSWMMEDTR